MPWKLVLFIGAVALILIFVGFNIENNCDISLVFVTFEGVPVVITILATYVLGLLSALIITVGRKGLKLGKTRGASSTSSPENQPLPGSGNNPRAKPDGEQ
ncbi:MAG: hypothetical protein JXM71_00230 [Spirochaetales bacterium]|nr:hypothetical protein [Spirochaetales bacterium]